MLSSLKHFLNTEFWFDDIIQDHYKIMDFLLLAIEVKLCEMRNVIWMKVKTLACA